MKQKFQIKLNKATKKYLDKCFTIEINENSFWLISGTNGSGKTTLIKLILGYIKPDSGLLERNCNKFSYLPENMELPEHVLVIDYLKLLKKIYKGHLNIQYLLDLDVPIYQVIGKLSKGNKQKVALISTFITESKFIILDEPFSGLDEKSINAALKIIKHEHEKGKTIFVSTHQPERFLKIATDRLVL